METLKAQSCTKYFQIVLSGISRFCFLKCLIILDRSPASASSNTMFNSLSSMKEARYLITFGWFSCWRDRLVVVVTKPVSWLPVAVGFPSCNPVWPCCPSSQRSAPSWVPLSGRRGWPLLCTPRWIVLFQSSCRCWTQWGRHMVNLRMLGRATPMDQPPCHPSWLFELSN